MQFCTFLILWYNVIRVQGNLYQIHTWTRPRTKNEGRRYYMREFLKGLDLDSELIDTIMAEHGKLVTKDKEELQTLKSQIKDLKENSKNANELQEKYNSNKNGTSKYRFNFKSRKYK